jgi:hypothetical protein
MLDAELHLSFSMGVVLLKILPDAASYATPMGPPPPVLTFATIPSVLSDIAETTLPTRLPEIATKISATSPTVGVDAVGPCA